MDELNINQLPVEILIEVFRYLNGRHLKNATLICKLWNNLIKSAFRWLLKLKSYDRLLSEKKNFALTTNLKFGTIAIEGFHLTKDSQILEIFKRHGFNVVELDFYGCTTDNLTEFAEILTLFPNLKRVFSYVVILHDSGDVLPMDELLPNLKKLKILEFRGYDYRTIKCFRKAKLTTIKIFKYGSSYHRSLLVDFLSTQDKLTALTVDSDSPSLLVDLGKLNDPIPFRLTQLSIAAISCQKPSQDYDNLVRFIKSQAGNLTEIELLGTVSSFVCECVVANMTKLTTFWVNFDSLPQDNDFYDRLKENRNVHTVKVTENDRLFDDRFVGKFLRNFPNIRCLILINGHRSWSKHFWAMAQSLSKLESLYIRWTFSLDVMKFPNLRTLHIGHLGGKINWNAFTNIHFRLTELTIPGLKKEYFTSDDIDQITTNVDLRHIRIGYDFVVDKRFLEIVESKCTNLQWLDMRWPCMSQFSKLFGFLEKRLYYQSLYMWPVEHHP